MQITRLNLFTRALVTCALGASSALACAQSVTSTAVTYGSDAIPPIIQSTTTTPGEQVAQSATVLVHARGPKGDYIYGSTSGASYALTDFGMNKVAAAGGLLGINTQTDFGVGYVNSNAYSQWADQWRVSGGKAGDPVSISISGRTSYALGLFNGALPMAPAFQASGFAQFGSGSVQFDNSDFAANAIPGFIDWSLSFAARSGDIFNVSMNLSVSISPSFGGLGLGETNKLWSFDSTHTSLVRSADLTDGYSLSAASGQLVAHDGAFAYLAVLAEEAPPPAVPEPQTYALMFGGLALIGVARRVRRDRAPNWPGIAPSHHG